MKGTELVPALCNTRARWARRVDRGGRRYELTIERCTWLEAWLSGQPRLYLASVDIRYPSEEVGSGRRWSGTEVMLGVFKRRQEAWRAAEQYHEQLFQILGECVAEQANREQPDGQASSSPR